MTAFTRYLKYMAKNMIIRIIVMATVVGMIAYNAGASKTERMFGEGGTYYYCSLTGILIVMLIYSVILAGMEFAPFKNRRNIDLWFSSPLSRHELVRAGLLSGVAQITLHTIVSVVLVAIKMAAFNTQGAGYNILLLLPFSLVCIVGSSLMFFMSSFLFIIANNVFDGCVYLMFFPFLPSRIYAAFSIISNVLSESDGRSYVEYLFPYSIPYTFSYAIDNIIVDKGRFFDPVQGTPLVQPLDTLKEPQFIVWTVIWSIVSISCIYFAHMTFVKLKAEKLGGQSDAVFGYNILIPAWCYTMIITNMVIHWITAFFCLIGMFVAYIIFRRGVKFKKSDIICLIIGGVLMVVTQIIAISTGNSILGRLV